MKELPTGGQRLAVQQYRERGRPVIATGMKFCGNCGAKTEEEKPKCPSCGAELIPGMKFCGNCGTKVVENKRICKECGLEIPDGMMFCGGCGTKYEE